MKLCAIEVTEKVGALEVATRVEFDLQDAESAEIAATVVTVVNAILHRDEDNGGT